jgi:hypothetical protein
VKTTAWATVWMVALTVLSFDAGATAIYQFQGFVTSPNPSEFGPGTPISGTL